MMARLCLITLCFAAFRTGDAIRGSTSFRSLRALQTVGQVDRFILMDADTDLPIIDLVNGTVINVATQSTSNFNIQVTIAANSGNVGSLLFGYNTNTAYRTESGVYLAFCGDGNPVGNYLVCKNLKVSAQPHIVSATPYSGTKANGAMGFTKAISFRIANIPPTTSPSSSPSKIPSSAPFTLPSMEPSNQPYAVPSMEPSNEPVAIPSMDPSIEPSLNPTPLPICNIPQVSI
jgi:hypothetical protein